MAGIDKITKEIELEADKEAASIVSAAEAAAQAARDKANQERDAYISAADEKLSRKLAEENKKSQSQCEQAEKLILLETKQFVIDDVLRKAKKELIFKRICIGMVLIVLATLIVYLCVSGYIPDLIDGFFALIE